MRADSQRQAESMTEAVLWIMNFAAWSFVCGLIGWTLNEWRHEDDEFRKEFGHLQ